MLSAMLISDMFGQTEDTSYILNWTSWLRNRGFQIAPVFVDELLPEIYKTQAKPPKEQLHSKITTPENMAMACKRVEARIELECPDLLLGFSYGGALAFSARESMPKSSKLVCISATRMRYFLPANCPPIVHAIFGADDPNWPAESHQGNAFLQQKLIKGVGHDLYKWPELCAEQLELILNLPRD